MLLRQNLEACAACFGNRNTVSQTLPDATQPPHAEMPTPADHLMDCSTHLVNSLNTRTFHLVAPIYMVPNFGGSHLMDQTPWFIGSRDEIISQMEEFLKTNPDFHTEILDMSVDLDSTTTAKVWVRRTDEGLAEGPKRETLMQLAWVYRDGEWLCDGYQGVRSFPFFGGDDAAARGGVRSGSTPKP